MNISNSSSYEHDVERNWAAEYAKRLVDAEAAERDAAIAAAIEIEEGKRVSSDNAIKDGTALEDNSIYSRHIREGNVTTGKIHDLNVTTEKIANGNVTTAKLADYAVTDMKIASGAVTERMINIDAVVTSKIKDKAVTTAKLYDGAVTDMKLAAGAVTAAKIEDGAVTLAKLDRALTTYSTTPQQVGTWIDDTPIWRVAINKALSAADFTAGFYQLSASDLGVLDVSEVKYILISCLRRYYPNDDAEDSVPLQIGESYKITLSGNTEYIVLCGFVELVTSADNIRSE